MYGCTYRRIWYKCTVFTHFKPRTSRDYKKSAYLLYYFYISQPLMIDIKPESLEQNSISQLNPVLNSCFLNKNRNHNSNNIISPNLRSPDQIQTNVDALWTWLDTDRQRFKDLNIS